MSNPKKGARYIGIYNNLKEKIFPHRETTKEISQFQMLNSHSNTFSAYHGDLYQSDLVQSAIRPYCNHIGKLIVKHLQGDNTNPNAQIRFLLEEPNEMMTMQQLLEKAIWDLRLNGNAFIHVRWERGAPVALHVLSPDSVTTESDRSNQIYLRMYFGDGSTRVIPYKHIIHLRGNFNEHDFFGDNPADALKELMETINTTETGIKNAIKNSSIIRWLISFKQSMREDDIKKKTKEVQKTFMSLDSKFGGVAAVDAKYDLKQVKNESNLYIPDNHVQNTFIKRVHDFFGVNEKIINSTYSEDEFTAWYEAECSPIIKQLSEEFTRKLFSRTQRSHGNKIVFEGENLLFASNKTKLQLTQLVDRSILSISEYRVILGLPPLEEDSFLLRREYGELNEVIKGTDADGNPIQIERATTSDNEGGEEDEARTEE